MSKKIEWIKRGMTANNGLHMQEICDQIADATGIENCLQKPTTAPSATQLVAVDNTNTQTMLNIGDGLSVENGSLKASGGKIYHKTAGFSVLNKLDNVSVISIDYYSSNNSIPNTFDELLNDIYGVSIKGSYSINGSVIFNLANSSTNFIFVPVYYSVDNPSTAVRKLQVFFQKLDISSGTPVITPFGSFEITSDLFSKSRIRVEEV